MSEITGVTFDISIAFIIILIIFIAQAVCYKYDWKPRMQQLSVDRKGSFISIVYIFICLICNTMSLFIQFLIRHAWSSCTICHSGYIINKILFVITRCVNQLFFTQRAKFSQNFQPILSDKYFDIILPSVIVLLQSLCFVEIIYFDIIYPIHRYGFLQCIQELHVCPTPSLGPSYRFTPLYIGSVCICIFITTIIVFLFLERIYIISSISHERISDTKVTRHEYKSMYISNAILVIINVALTQFMITMWPLYPTLFWFMPPIDNVFNALTMYLIPGRNRQWNRKMCHCLCEAICCGKCRALRLPPSSPELAVSPDSDSQSRPIPMELVHGETNKLRATASIVTQTNVFEYKKQKTHRATSICSDITVKYDTEQVDRQRNSSSKKQWATRASKFDSVPRAPQRLYTDDTALVDALSTKHLNDIMVSSVLSGGSSNFNQDDDDYGYPQVTRFMTVEESKLRKNKVLLE